MTQTHFTVTLPWNPSNQDEGDYCVTVLADDTTAAVLAAAEEMAEVREVSFVTDEERAAFIAVLVSDGGDVVATEDAFKNNLSTLFGINGDIDMDALAEVLEENRLRFTDVGKRGLWSQQP